MGGAHLHQTCILQRKREPWEWCSVGSRLRIVFKLVKLVVAFLGYLLFIVTFSQWLISGWLGMGSRFPNMRLDYLGDAWEAPTSIQRASFSGRGNPVYGVLSAPSSASF